MRSDWTKEARYLLFNAGPYGGFHGHEDKLSIEIYAYGQTFIVDPGSYTYYPEDPFRLYFVGSQGHNTLLVDNQSQIRRWQKVNRIPKPALGNYATWIRRTDFDYVAATYNDGYGLFSLKKPEGAPIIEDVTHTRRILFVKPDYWVIVDELQATNPHSYQLLFHTAPEIEVEADLDNHMVLRTSPDAAALHLIPVGPENIKASCQTGSKNPIQGWYSATFDHKTPSTTITYEWEGHSSTLTTLLYPCPGGRVRERVNIESLAVSGGKGVAFAITTDYGRDYFMFSQDNSLKQFSLYESRGIVAGIRTDKNGDILANFEWQGE
jgi:hypothetical protein